MMILRPILDPKIGTIRRFKAERFIGIAESSLQGVRRGSCPDAVVPLALGRALLEGRDGGGRVRTRWRT